MSRSPVSQTNGVHCWLAHCTCTEYLHGDGTRSADLSMYLGKQHLINAHVHRSFNMLLDVWMCAKMTNNIECMDMLLRSINMAPDPWIYSRTVNHCPAIVLCWSQVRCSLDTNCQPVWQKALSMMLHLDFVSTFPYYILGACVPLTSTIESMSNPPDKHV